MDNQPVGASLRELWGLGNQEKALAPSGNAGLGLVLTPGGRSQPLGQMHKCSLQPVRQ